MPTLAGKPKDEKIIKEHPHTVSSRFTLPEGIISDEVVQVMLRHAYGKSILSIINSAALSKVRTPSDLFFEYIYDEVSGAYSNNDEERHVKTGVLRRYIPPKGHLSKSRIVSMYYRPLKMWAKRNPYIRSDVERAKRYLDYKKKGIVHKTKIDYLSWIASSFRALVNNDFDAWIGVVGYEGTGKSAFALGLARYLGYYGFKFNPLTNIFFASTPVDYIIDMMENTEEQVFIFDEASAFFDNRNSQKAEQKRLIQTMIMNRARRHVVILCTPDIKGIDVKLRERRVTMIFQLLDRNHFAVLLKHTIGQTEDGFMYKAINKSILAKHDQNTYSLINTFLNLPTCYGVFRTSGMLVSKATYNFYKKMKMELNKVTSGNTPSASSPSMVVFDFLAYIIKNRKELLSDYSKYIGVDPEVLKAMIKMVVPKKSFIRQQNVEEIYNEIMKKTRTEPSKHIIEGVVEGQDPKATLDSIIEEKIKEVDEMDEEEIEESDEEQVEVNEDELRKIIEEDDDAYEDIADEIEEIEDDEENIPSV